MSRSLTKAKCHVVVNTKFELLWLLSLFKELQVSLPSKLIMYYDNISTTYDCANPKLHSKMKHVNIDFHFVRDGVGAGDLLVSHISSKRSLVEALTKSLSR